MLEGSTYYHRVFISVTLRRQWYHACADGGESWGHKGKIRSVQRPGLSSNACYDAMKPWYDGLLLLFVARVH